MADAFIRHSPGLTPRAPNTRAASAATLQIFVEEGDGVVDRPDLHGIGLIDSLLVPPYIDKAMHIVVVARPLRGLAELDQQVVADPEYALQLIGVAALHKDRRLDRRHALPGDVLGNAGAD